MDPLSKLACKWHTDKRPSLPGAPGHGYTKVYHSLFAGMKVKRLLEIGIGSRAVMSAFVEDYIPGASLRMWEEYFPEAHIYGLDNDPSCFINEGRIHSSFVDVKSKIGLSLAAYGSSYDVVIDDATHDPEDQIRAANAFIPSVRAGGFYIIEDVGDIRIIQDIPYNCDVIDLRTAEEIKDWKYPSRLVIVTNGSRHV